MEDVMGLYCYDGVRSLCSIHCQPNFPNEALIYLDVQSVLLIPASAGWA